MLILKVTTAGIVVIMQKKFSEIKYQYFPVQLRPLFFPFQIKPDLNFSSTIIGLLQTVSKPYTCCIRNDRLRRLINI